MRKRPAVGIRNPQGEKFGLHTLDAAGIAGLRDLIAQHQSKAERVLDQAVAVRVCCGGGYAAFWLVGWVRRWRSRR